MDLSQCEETSKKKQTCLNTSWFLLNKELFMRDLNLLSKKISEDLFDQNQVFPYFWKSIPFKRL